MNGKGERVAILIDGGTGPVQLRDSRELFYRAGDDLMSVQVKTTPTLAIGERRKLLDLAAYDPGYYHEFDVSARRPAVPVDSDRDRAASHQVERDPQLVRRTQATRAGE